jgi:hypothetical protein
MTWVLASTWSVSTSRSSYRSPAGGEGRVILTSGGVGWPCPDRHPACRNSKQPESLALSVRNTGMPASRVGGGLKTPPCYGSAGGWGFGGLWPPGEKGLEDIPPRAHFSLTRLSKRYNDSASNDPANTTKETTANPQKKDPVAWTKYPIMTGAMIPLIVPQVSINPLFGHRARPHSAQCRPVKPAAPPDAGSEHRRWPSDRLRAS